MAGLIVRRDVYHMLLSDSPVYCWGMGVLVQPEEKQGPPDGRSKEVQI